MVITIIVKHGPPSFEAQKSGLNNSEMVWVLMMAEWTLKLGLSLVRVSYWPNLRYNYDYSSSHKKVPPLITLQEKFWNLSFRDKVCFKDTDPFYLVSKESFLKIKHVKHFRSYCSIIVHVKRKWACAEKWHVKVIPWFAKWTHKKRNGVPKNSHERSFYLIQISHSISDTHINLEKAMNTTINFCKSERPICGPNSEKINWRKNLKNYELNNE